VLRFLVQCRPKTGAGDTAAADMVVRSYDRMTRRWRYLLEKICYRNKNAVPGDFPRSAHVAGTAPNLLPGHGAADDDGECVSLGADWYYAAT
jgi:hypothetical protein